MDEKRTLDKKYNILRLTIPLFFESLLVILVNNVDQFMLSDHSEEAVAAVGNANQVSWVLVLFLTVLSTASTILISQYKGAHDKESEQTIYPLAIAVNLIIGAVISAVCLFLSRDFFTLMNVESGKTIEYATQYLTITGGTILTQAIILTFSAFLRSNTFMKEALAASVTANILNIIGNYIALYILDWGVMGVGVSTAASRFAAMIMIIIMFRIRIGKINWSLLFKGKPVRHLLKMLKIGIPAAGESLSYDSSQLCIMGFINTMGNTSVNTKIYVYMIVAVAYLFTSAVTQAMQVVIGYLLGGRQTQEAEKRVWKTLVLAIISSVSLTALLWVFSDQVLSIFTDNKEVLELGKKIFAIEIVLEFGRACNITMVRALQASGDVKFPTIMSIAFSWCVSVSLGYVFGIVCSMGLVGIWIAMTTDEVVRGFILITRFKRGKWKKLDLIGDREKEQPALA